MITVNGKEVSAAGCSVSDYLEQNQYQVRRIAVERNGEILPKSHYAADPVKRRRPSGNRHIRRRRLNP